MFVDIFLKNGTIDFDQNHSNVKHNARTLVVENIKDFRVSHHAEICQLDRFSLKLISIEHVVLIMEFPDWFQVKKRYTTEATTFR